ncbi:hypothetical protein PR003_g4950 [Phytophthora rubi]|uniref:Uncharacterized protein n=1 Tax=Phytophthora rubi TaxID=129364 RepID=A0A6A4FKT0_9STRA|nr:hypothetical protein PR003_g4950 [Phytophthora rubi]
MATTLGPPPFASQLPCRNARQPQTHRHISHRLSPSPQHGRIYPEPAISVGGELANPAREVQRTKTMKAALCARPSTLLCAALQHRVDSLAEAHRHSYPPPRPVDDHWFRRHDRLRRDGRLSNSPRAFRYMYSAADAAVSDMKQAGRHRIHHASRARPQWKPAAETPGLDPGVASGSEIVVMGVRARARCLISPQTFLVLRRWSRLSPAIEDDRRVRAAD